MPAEAEDPYSMGAKTFENAPIGCHKRVTNDRVRWWRDASDGVASSLQTGTFRQRPPSFAFPWYESGGLEGPSSNLDASIEVALRRDGGVQDLEERPDREVAKDRGGACREG